eukprot:7224916-Alexandrium_andersonii.AAC.1
MKVALAQEPRARTHKALVESPQFLQEGANAPVSPAHGDDKPMRWMNSSWSGSVDPYGASAQPPPPGGPPPRS